MERIAADEERLLQRNLGLGGRQLSHSFYLVAGSHQSYTHSMSPSTHRYRHQALTKWAHAFIPARRIEIPAFVRSRSRPRWDLDPGRRASSQEQPKVPEPGLLFCFGYLGPTAGLAEREAPKDHINVRILHPGLLCFGECDSFSFGGLVGVHLWWLPEIYALAHRGCCKELKKLSYDN